MSSRSSSLGVRALVAASALAAALLLASMATRAEWMPVAGAAPAVCAFDSATRAVAITVAPSGEALLARDGAGRILVDGLPCGTATTATVTSIAVAGAPSTAEAVVVDAGAGPLVVATPDPVPPAPGPPAPAPPGPAAPPPAPIRISVDLAGATLPSVDRLEVRGTPSSDRLDADLAPASTAQVHVKTGSVVVAEVEVALGAGTMIELSGGAGDDDLAGSPFADVLDGGPGSDTLAGGGGGDRYRFGDALTAEQDGIVESASAAGVDILDLGAVGDAVVVRLAAPGGVLATHSGRSIAAIGDVAIEAVTTGAGADDIEASAAPNSISTGAGNDRVDARGAGPDRVSCGDGQDLVRADADDELAPDCEPAPAPSPSPPPPPQPPAPGPPAPVAALMPPSPPAGPARPDKPKPARAPAVSIGGRSLTVSRQGTVRVLVRCPSVAQGACRLDVVLWARQPIVLADGRTVEKLGAARRSIEPGRTRSVAIGLGAKQTRAVRDQGTIGVLLSVKVRDDSPHSHTTRKRFLLRAAR